jgi:hypothetical protein
MGASEVGRPTADDERQDVEVREAPPEPPLPPEECDEDVLRALAHSEQEIAEYVAVIAKDDGLVSEALAQNGRASDDYVANVKKGATRGIAIGIGTQVGKVIWVHFIKPLIEH